MSNSVCALSYVDFGLFFGETFRVYEALFVSFPLTAIRSNICLWIYELIFYTSFLRGWDAIETVEPFPKVSECVQRTGFGLHNPKVGLSRASD
jgi:hypothetical protein